MFLVLYNYDNLSHLKYFSKSNTEKLDSTLIHFVSKSKIIVLSLL